MEFTDRDMQACTQYFAREIYEQFSVLFPASFYPNLRMISTPGCNFAFINFGGTSVHGCVKYNRIYISIDPFRTGNRVGLTEEPFSPRVITGRLMLDDQFRSVEFSWATVVDMKAGIEDLIGKTRRKSCFKFCPVV